MQGGSQTHLSISGSTHILGSLNETVPYLHQDIDNVPQDFDIQHALRDILNLYMEGLFLIIDRFNETAVSSTNPLYT
jgi:hypothetical protein